jgi:hypothetical protein
MSGVSVTRDMFRMTVSVPDDLVGLAADGDADGEWAAWLGVTCRPADGRSALVLVSITVTAYTPPPGASGAEALAGANAAEALAARLRANGADVEEFVTSGGSPAVGTRRVVTRRTGGRDVTTGQAQALVVYPGPRALGVVSGVCPDPDDLEQAAALVTAVAAGMTVTGASAAA